MVEIKKPPLAAEDAKGMSTEISHPHSTKSLCNSPIQNNIAAYTKKCLVIAGLNGVIPRKLCTWLIQALNLSGV